MNILPRKTSSGGHHAAFFSVLIFYGGFVFGSREPAGPIAFSQERSKAMAKRSRRPDETNPDDEFTIKVNGRLGTAGTVNFHLGGKVVGELFLPPQEMGIVSALIDEVDNTGWSGGFVTTNTLADKLYFNNLASDRDPNVVVKAVHRLRARLDKLDVSAFAAADPDGRSFGMRLVESKRYLGYRLGLPAERITRPPGDTPTPPAPHFGLNSEPKEDVHSMQKRSDSP